MNALSSLKVGKSALIWLCFSFWYQWYPKVNKMENPFSPLIMVSGETSVSKNRSLGVGEQKTSVIVLFEN